jgi:hypothetical protein
MIAALLVTPLVGCSKEVALIDVGDAASLFHFKVPSDWQVQNTAGLITVYADKELPSEEGGGDALTVVVIQRPEVASQSMEDALLEVIESRKASRGWESAFLSQATSATVGGRWAARVDVELVDATGKEFKSGYVLARSSGVDVLIYGAAPSDRWESQKGDFDLILERWFWHTEAKPGEAVEPTATVEPTSTP